MNVLDNDDAEESPPLAHTSYHSQTTPMSPGMNTSLNYRDPHENISMQVISSKDYLSQVQNNSFTEAEVSASTKNMMSGHAQSLKKNEANKLRSTENVEMSTRYKTNLQDPKQDMR